MSLTLAYDLANFTPADANPPQSNFSRIEQYINQEVITRDGSTAMTGPLKLAGDPTNPLEAATKQYVDLLLPIGVILPFGGSVTPGGGTVWLVADGRELAEVDYPDLYNAIGRSYGGTPGNFWLPNLAGCVPVGNGGTLGAAIGARGGNKDAAVVTHVHNARHAHGASSNVVNLDHFHTQRDHKHRNVSDPAGQHGHNFGHGSQIYYYGPNGWTTVPDGGGNSTQLATFSHDGSHTHTFWSEGPSDPYTSWWSEISPHDAATASRAQHGHTITVNENNFDTAPTGESATNRNMPPYVAVNWIIRVK